MARASEKGRGEGESLQEIYFWILNFLVLGVWLGALGQGPQGEEEAGLENLFFNSKFPRFGWERTPFGGIRGAGWRGSLGWLGRRLVRGAQAEQEAAGLGKFSLQF